MSKIDVILTMYILDMFNDLQYFGTDGIIIK